jgi:hypothetical protein
MTTTTNENDISLNDPTTSPINISLNICFRSFATAKYQAGRDVYGNRDLAAYEDGRRDIEKIVRRFLTSTASTGGGDKTDPSLTTPDGSTFDDGDGLLPKVITKAYLERLADELREKAEKL